MKLTAEVQMMLEQKIIPFWLSLQDDHYGGFVSYVDLNLRRNEKAGSSGFFPKRQCC